MTARGKCQVLFTFFLEIFCCKKENHSMSGFPKKIILNLVLYSFKIEADGAEAVVAGYHCAIRVFHPAVIEVALAFCQCGDKLHHTAPCAVAKPLRLLSVNGQENVAFVQVASVGDRVFIHLLQVGVVCFAYCCNLHFVHKHLYNTILALFTENTIPFSYTAY